MRGDTAVRAELIHHSSARHLIIRVADASTLSKRLGGMWTEADAVRTHTVGVPSPAFRIRTRYCSLTRLRKLTADYPLSIAKSELVVFD